MSTYTLLLLLLFDDEIKMAKKPEEKIYNIQITLPCSPVGWTGECKWWRGNIRKGCRERKTETVLQEVESFSCATGIFDRFIAEPYFQNTLKNERYKKHLINITV